MNKKAKDIIYISVMIIIITFFHYFSISSDWGIHDFYRRLYYIPIIVSAFKFKLRGGIITPIIISLLYAPHLFIYFGLIDIEILNQFLEIIMFLLIGIITGFLVESDNRKKKLLSYQIEKLSDLENYTQNILNSITNVLISVDKSFNIRSINKEGINLLKQTEEQFIGENINKFFIEHEKIRKVLKEVIDTKYKKINIETRFRIKNSDILDVRLLAYPLKNIGGNIEGVVIILEDISEIKKLEKQIRRTEKLSAIGELASGIAHEIRNPMGIIKTISQTLHSETEDEDLKEGLSIINHEINRANNVIKELLNFAKPQINSEQNINLNKLINDIVLITKKYAKQHNVNIEYNSTEIREILVDGEKLKQAFINIIFNAIQAMPRGGKLDINLIEEKNNLVISFKDTGIGISKEKIEKIFEPFFTTKDSGTGLGLSITHSIIEEHNGYIEINSEIDKGTEISIYLPKAY
ncbi:MAG: two-component system sensor histidine kinase NtrB [Senegalia sp. (in: firmicutes)]|uniref:two-component system sensor histidine kinase NtrB n=1 Tax=Senegalia sp. (in: firmicutes) TaxID=1924098 RepID=UPI003F94FBCA